MYYFSLLWNNVDLKESPVAAFLAQRFPTFFESLLKEPTGLLHFQAWNKIRLEVSKRTSSRLSCLYNNKSRASQIYSKFGMLGFLFISSAIWQCFPSTSHFLKIGKQAKLLLLQLGSLASDRPHRPNCGPHRHKWRPKGSGRLCGR